ncbi:P450 monooxygenase AflN 2 [Colletotrichum chlorophyti]|uniref:p450 monooxygenase AflN 2 n=1 Tax=Colletotrichum chlorophyti TaxID=708187 RepID=A0A1Q8RXR6_9PEZI|nr:P450 monooxygenase AflN 2 [Colletotrichum chlorophyti]
MHNELLPSIERSLRQTTHKRGSMKTIIDLALKPNPGVAEKMRAEHDRILGPDPAKASNKLVGSPHLLNALTYTGAVIKESVRLYPGPGSFRDGEPRYHLADRETGEKYLTDGFMLWESVRSQSRSEAVWPRPLEVLPERWLTTDVNDPLYPTKHARRNFGIGYRNCMGQELAVVEMKLVLALLVRHIDLDCAWDERDAMK